MVDGEKFMGELGMHACSVAVPGRHADSVDHASVMLGSSSLPLPSMSEKGQIASS
jgi:hypothetical protein